MPELLSRCDAGHTHWTPGCLICPPPTKADVLVSLRDYALVLRECDRAMAWQVADRLDALAAAIEAWCVVEGGHRWRRELSERPQDCVTCGQRRAEEA